MALRPTARAIAEIIERRMVRGGVPGASEKAVAAWFDVNLGAVEAAVEAAGLPDLVAALPDPPAPTEPVRAEHVMCANCGNVRHRDDPEEHVAIHGIMCRGANGLEGGATFYRWMKPEDAQWSAYRSAYMARRARCPVCLGFAPVGKGRIGHHVRAVLRRDGLRRKPVECEGVGVPLRRMEWEGGADPLSYPPDGTEEVSHAHVGDDLWIIGQRGAVYFVMFQRPAEDALVWTGDRWHQEREVWHRGHAREVRVTPPAPFASVRAAQLAAEQLPTPPGVA